MTAAALVIRSTLPARRVLFNVPCDNERFLSKAVGMPVDCLTLDLEDGVGEEKKEVARDRLRAMLMETAPLARFPHSREVLVRINGADSPHFDADLACLASIPAERRPHGILLPKTESAAHLKRLNQWVDAHYGSHQPQPSLLLAIETARGIVDLKDTLSGGDIRRAQALIFASEDYCADLGLSRSPEASEMLWARSQLVAHARAFRLQAIDMVCIDYQNKEQLVRECQDGVRMGFDGKQAIHPSQIDVILDHFRPSKTTLQFARDILAAVELHGGKPFVLQGIVVDTPVVKWAQLINSSRE